MTTVAKKALQGLIEPHIYDQLQQDTYTIRWVAPETLLSWRRMDLGLRTLYLQYKDICPELAKEVYYQDIKAQSLGDFTDPDNSSKSGLENYCHIFNQTYAAIVQEGFDASKTIIPLSSDGTILNGGHRAACTLEASRQVAVVQTELPPITCDYRYFYARAVPLPLIEMAVRKIISFANNIYLAFLWPSGNQYIGDSVGLFSKVVYKKAVKFSPAGAHRILWHCYHHMDWIGTPEDGYSGLQKKQMECFPDPGECTIIAFQAADLGAVRAIKEKIRSLNNIGFSSVHITDTPAEARKLADVVFDENQLHFINNKKDRNYSSPDKWKQLKHALDSAGLHADDMVIDGSAVLELYGIRKAEDIDALSTNPAVFQLVPMVQNHADEIIFHKKTKQALIYDPRVYFMYETLKFISFDQCYAFKKNRSEPKDLIDLELMQGLLNRDALHLLMAELKQKFFYFRIRLKRNIFSAIVFFLKAAMLYEVARKISQGIKRNYAHAKLFFISRFWHPFCSVLNIKGGQLKFYQGEVVSYYDQLQPESRSGSDDSECSNSIFQGFRIHRYRWRLKRRQPGGDTKV